MNGNSKEKSLINRYAQSNAMTAGRIKTIVILLDKAKELIRSINPHQIEKHMSKVSRAKNIIAQLEMALNFEEGPSAGDILELYELVYQALENPTEKSLKNALFLLGHFKDTLELAMKG